MITVTTVVVGGIFAEALKGGGAEEVLLFDVF